MKEHWDALMGRAGFWVTMSICLVVAGISGYFLLFDKETPQPAETLPVHQEAPVPEQPVQEEKVPEPVVETIQPEVIPVEIPVMPEVEIDDTPVIAEAPQLVVAPLKGDVLTAFSMDTLVYNPTLDDWRTHDGIDISAEAGTAVVAAAAGTVIAVGEDGRLGVTIQIEHSGGYVTTYASLHPETQVEVGDSVEAGTIIGYVGNTSLSEAGLGAHLHFAVTRNGENIDPEAYLPKES